MSTPTKTFMMDGVSMPAPNYEYEEFENSEEHEGEDEECDDGLIAQMGQHSLDDEGADEGEEGYSDEEEGEDEALQALKSDVVPAPMPTDFYNEFESFLTKPPPKFAASADTNARPKKKKSGDDVSLPRLGSGDKTGAPNGKSKSSVSSKIKSKVTASRAIDASGVGKTFDPALLQEAFAYADRLQHEVGEEDCEPVGRGEERKMPAKSGSAPQLSKPQKSNNGGSERRLNPYERQQQMRKPSKKASGKSGNQNKEGIVKRLRSKTSMEAPDDKAFSNISTKGLEHSRSKGGVDYAALVENFENGTTLHKLKAELAASRQSMAESENFMKQMSKEYSQKRRR